MSESEGPPDPEEWSDEQVDALLERLEERVDTDSELGQAIVSRRRDVLKAIGAVGTGGALGAVGMDAVSRDAAAADSSVGQIGTGGSSVDVTLDQLEDPGGDVVADIDDTGDIDWQSRGFDNLASIETGSVVDKSSGNSYDVDNLAGGGELRFDISTINISDGQVHGIREYFPSGETVNILEVGVQNDNNNAPTGLAAEVRDETNATTLVSKNSKDASGSPLGSVSGAVDLFFRINNTTGSAQNATAVFVIEVV